MAYTLGNKCAKNLCKRTVLLQFIIENVVTCLFFETQCRSIWKLHDILYDYKVELTGVGSRSQINVDDNIVT